MTRAKATYKPVSFGDVPGWAEDDHAAAFGAFRRSCARLSAIAKAAPAAGAALKSPPASVLLAACDTAARMPAKPTAAAARAFFERQFTPHAVVHKGASGLLTGYYEPVLEGSRKPTRKFNVPVHGRPADLVNLVDETERGAVGNDLTHARRTAGVVEPFAARAEIDAGALAGQDLELVYVADSVDKFFMQIQGSGRIKLTDGTTIRLGYDGKNGHPYTSVGRYLIDKGIIGADRMTLAALGNWLREDPVRGRSVMWQNKSYVFFRELKGAEADGPVGALGIPLTTGRSLAVDAGYHALGLPVFVAAPALVHAEPSGKPFRRLLIAQDVGSAIKGPERGDIYFGSGDAAGRRAGVTKHAGTFHVLLPAVATAAAALRPSAIDADPAPVSNTLPRKKSDR